jgi:hypothetical protein
MTGHGRGGKPKARFPPRPQPLEIANNAIPTFPPSRRRFLAHDNQSERRPGGWSLTSLLQAHSWMRICCVYLTQGVFDLNEGSAGTGFLQNSSNPITGASPAT